MKWHLLNQVCVNTLAESRQMSVLEEVVSSEQQLVQVLVSGQVSSQTLISHSHGLPCYNQTGVKGVCRT